MDTQILALSNHGSSSSKDPHHSKISFDFKPEYEPDSLKHSEYENNGWEWESWESFEFQKLCD